MALRLKGKTAVVTGGTDGIGKMIAVQYMREGVNVVAAGRNPEKGIKMAREFDCKIEFMQADVSDAKAVNDLIDYTANKYGGIDIVVNNAGILFDGTIEDTSPEDWDRIMANNLKSAFLCSKYAIQHMRKKLSGSIINISSVDAFWAEPELGAYCASKGGVLALTKSVALDFGKDGIRCNAICPGYIETEMLQQFFNVQRNPETARREITHKHPLRRLGTTQDVASMAVWLASEESSFVTGQHFVLDGGLTSGHVIS